MSDGSSKLIAIDEETDHEIVHGRRFGKTDRATHEPLDPHAQIDVLTSIFWVWALPIVCCSGAIWRS